MNILLVTQNYYPLIGGVETHARQIAHDLAKTHQVRVVAGNFTPCRLPARLAMLHTNLLSPSYADYQDHEIPVHALTPSRFDRLRMLPIAVRAFPKLQRYAYDALNEFGYLQFRSVYLPRLLNLMQGVDVVHSLAGGYLGWTAQAAAQALRIPFVCTTFMHPHQWGDDGASVAYYQRSQAVIALTQSERQYLLSLGVSTEKVHVIGVSPDLPPTSDPTNFRKQHGLQAFPLVLFVGRMMPEKGAKALLEATEAVWQQLPETRFVFIGPQTAESSEWFGQIDPRILYLGKVSFQEKANALAACDLFCMPSTSESFGIVFLEAWSFRKPVIGGDAHVSPELIVDNQAGMIASQNAESISEAIIKLLLDSDLRHRYGQAGYLLTMKQYTPEAIVGKLENLYGDLTKQNKVDLFTLQQ